MPDDPSTLAGDLPTVLIGRPLLHYPSVGSTNDLAGQQARAGHAEGLVICADQQRAGRGRTGRAWVAPPASSLLMSLLLRPRWLSPADAFLLTMMAGVALCEAVERCVPVQAGLKWPNDLMLPAAPQAPALRKAAGILSELELIDGQMLDWAVIGIGVNVTWEPAGVVDGRELALVATSLSAAAGQTVDRWELLRNLLLRLDERYAALRRGRREELFQSWRRRLTMLGQPITVRLPHGELSGIAEDVELSGALRLRTQQGDLHTITAGDVGT